MLVLYILVSDRARWLKIEETGRGDFTMADYQVT